MEAEAAMAVSGAAEPTAAMAELAVGAAPALEPSKSWPGDASMRMARSRRAVPTGLQDRAAGLPDLEASELLAFQAPPGVAEAARPVMARPDAREAEVAPVASGLPVAPEEPARAGPAACSSS